MPETQPTPSPDPATRAMLALVLTRGLGPRLIARAVERCGSATGVLGASAAQLGEVEGISPKNAGKLKRAIDDAASPGGAADRELDLAAKHSAVVVSIDGPGYPALLKVIHDVPPVLWVKGELSPDDALSVAIVGSRKCSHYGREQADLIGNGLAHAGVTVVSGGAYGIDIAAHEGALRAAKAGAAAHGGRTVAVLGSGLAKPYPAEHVGLLREIVAGGEDGSACGAVVSEFPMGTEPRPENFLRRNRIISGMSLGVLVVEAGKRSGALSTARRCVEEHGRELMALPGRVDSAYAFGCHQIIREGWGRLVTGVSDILDMVGGEAPMLQAAAELAVPSPAAESNNLPERGGAASSSPTAEKILVMLDEPRSLDEIAAWTGLPAGSVQAELTMLEIRGAVKREGGLFVRRR